MTTDWWLVSHPIGCFWLLAPKFWEVVGTHESFFCHPINVGSVVGIPLGNKKNLFELIAPKRGWRQKNFGCEHSRSGMRLAVAPMSHLVKLLLPPANEFAKVMFLHVSVILSTSGDAWYWGGGVPGPGGVWSWGVPGPGGCLLLGVCVPGGNPPGRLLLRAVRILLECILVT